MIERAEQQHDVARGVRQKGQRCRRGTRDTGNLALKTRLREPRYGRVEEPLCYVHEMHGAAAAGQYFTIVTGTSANIRHRHPVSDVALEIAERDRVLHR